MVMQGLIHIEALHAVVVATYKEVIRERPEKRKGWREELQESRVMEKHSLQPTFGEIWLRPVLRLCVQESNKD